MVEMNSLQVNDIWEKHFTGNDVDWMKENAIHLTRRRFKMPSAAINMYFTSIENDLTWNRQCWIYMNHSNWWLVVLKHWWPRFINVFLSSTIIGTYTIIHAWNHCCIRWTLRIYRFLFNFRRTLLFEQNYYYSRFASAAMRFLNRIQYFTRADDCTIAHSGSGDWMKSMLREFSFLVYRLRCHSAGVAIQATRKGQID